MTDNRTYNEILKIGQRICEINAKAHSVNFLHAMKGDYDDEYIATARGVEQYFMSLGWTPPEK